jgi:hypothetical protein
MVRQPFLPFAVSNFFLSTPHFLVARVAVVFSRRRLHDSSGGVPTKYNARERDMCCQHCTPESLIFLGLRRIIGRVLTLKMARTRTVVPVLTDKVAAFIEVLPTPFTLESINVL